MFQILNFLTDDGVDLLNSTFVMVGRLYGYMIDIATTTSSQNLNKYISSLTESFYTIAGIFMLFRLTISVFGYILDPDKMTDSKAGGGKLLTNIVITVVLVIGFYPNGFIFSFLQDVEDVFLFQSNESSSGFFNNIFNNIGDTENQESYKNNLIVENVNAKKSGNKLICYFKNYTSGTSNIDSLPTDNVTIKLDSSGKTNSISSTTFVLDSSAKGKKSCDDLALTYTTTNVVGGRGNGTIHKWNVVSASSISENQTDWPADVKARWSLSETEEGATGRLNKLYTHNLSLREGSFANGVAGSFYSCNLNDKSARNKFLKDYKKTLKDSNFNIYNGIESDESKLCYAFEVSPLYIMNAGKNGKKLVEDQKLDYYFFTGVIFAIVISVYLIILCVEVIVRNLKLILFQIIAPIPLINGIDPNDKMRSQWFKSYFGAYLDLFMKIFAIQLLAKIAPATADLMSDKGPIGKLFFLVALLTFVKIVPNLISKILGIESFGGSIKSTGGMIKKGFGLGVGATVGSALGGIVGGITAEGKGATVKNTLKGLASGAKMGAKGGLGKVASNITAATAKENRQRADGLNWWQRKKSNVMEAAGYDPQRKFDNQISQMVGEKQLLDEFRKNKDNIESMADSSNHLSDESSKLANEADPNNYTYTRDLIDSRGRKIIATDKSGQKLYRTDANGNKVPVYLQETFKGKEAYKKRREDFIALNEQNKKNDKGNIEFYDSVTKSWIDTGQSDSYISRVLRDDNGDLIKDSKGAIQFESTGIKYEKAAQGKISQAEIEMNAQLMDNNDLRKLLDMDINSAREVDTFAEFAELESKAKDKSNERNAKIIKMQSSDEYRQASGMGSSSK